MPGSFKDDISSLQDKLEVLDRERYRGAIVRARAESWATGEAPTKRALSLEKSYARRNDITEIERDGTVTSDKEEIECAFFEYYNRLFASSPVNVELFKKEFLSFMPRIDDAAKEVLEFTITVEEVIVAIDALNPGKSPGPDGLCAAFYKTLKRELAPILAHVFNEAYVLKILPPSFTLSHTVLIPKTEDAVKLLSRSFSPGSAGNIVHRDNKRR